MSKKYKLTITVLTMNRAEQLKNAVNSCLKSDLPEKTQFVIVDNASTDETEAVVEAMKKDFPYDLVYKKEDVNRGVGGGRNVCYDLAEGEYVYFLDDDAEIAEECYKTFFMSTIEYLDKNPYVATLTTHIHDEVFGKREVATSPTLEIDGLKCVYTFHGGTAFIRSACFSSPLFMNIMYGNEEVPISMSALDGGYYNVFNPDIFINHYPKNKWATDMSKLVVQGVSNIYAFKKMQYPFIFVPVLYMVYRLRLFRYKITDKALVKEFTRNRKEILKTNKLKKIKIKTIIKSFKNFGMTTF